jgi:putative transposase
VYLISALSNIFSLQRACYHQVKGTLSAQMTISAIRLVAGAYASAKSNKKPAGRPFLFKKARALFLIGKRGRDADFRDDGTLSIWTIAGRKRLTYCIPDDFKATFERATEIDSLTVIKRDGQLIGRVTVTLDVPEPQGILPVGIDLNETNALVAVDPDGIAPVPLPNRRPNSLSSGHQLTPSSSLKICTCLLRKRARSEAEH